MAIKTIAELVELGGHLGPRNIPTIEIENRGGRIFVQDSSRVSAEEVEMLCNGIQLRLMLPDGSYYMVAHSGGMKPPMPIKRMFRELGGTAYNL